MRKQLLTFATLAKISVLSILAQAAGSQGALGQGYDFAASLALGIKHDDNIQQAADSQPQDESLIGVIEPSFQFGAKGNKMTIAADYTLHHASYRYDPKDDHTNHNFDAESELRLNSRNNISFNIGFHKQQDQQTSVNRADPREKTGNRYHYYYAGGQYQLGSDAARGQLKLQANREWLRYDNNLRTNSQNLAKERDTNKGSATFSLRATPKTSLLAEIVYKDFDYISKINSLDSHAIQYFIGATWEATAKTSGSVRLGREEKEFEFKGFRDLDQPSWDASITWAPRTYSSFTIITQQSFSEGSAFEVASETTNSSLTWQHDWNYKLGSTLRYTKESNEFIGGIFDGRKDDTATLNSKVTFSFDRAELFVGYTRVERESNRSIEEFDRNIAEVGIKLAL